MEFICEMGTFINSTWHAFTDLHIVNQGLLACLVGYVTLKVSAGCFKSFFSKLFGIPRLADDPSNAKYDPKKIYLHFFPRKMIANVPNGSPFGLKTETWLRMTKLDYEAVETTRMSRGTQQIPYIFHNGKEITDSDLIIEYIENEFGLDSSEGLNPEQQSFTRACTKMLDENSLWVFVVYRIKCDLDNMKAMVNMGMPKMVQSVLTSKMFAAGMVKMKLRGVGRKSIEELIRIGKADIYAVSNYLGDKKFMFGNEMSKVDCAIYAHLMTGVCNSPKSPLTEFLREECKNLTPYLERIKEKCWPDWDELSTFKLKF